MNTVVEPTPEIPRISNTRQTMDKMTNGNVKVKGKVFSVRQFSTKSWRRIGERKYSSTNS
jgi:hypothetical protein